MSRSAWQAAAARFVISDSLGQEYCRRYGERPYSIVTDGLSSVGAVRTPATPDTLRIYFMGLFHMPYEQNLRALLDALEIVQRDVPMRQIDVTLRCEHVRPQVIAGNIAVTVLPFSDEAQVQRDMEAADFLYMPLPFGAEHENFTRYSLSTKMVTYVGSGLPILYHGPASSAAFALLDEHQAAVLLPTLVPEEIAKVLRGLTAETRSNVARNALELARRSFLLSDQAERFWSAISKQFEQA